jgi:hypothetical protein
LELVDGLLQAGGVEAAELPEAVAGLVDGLLGDPPDPWRRVPNTADADPGRPHQDLLSTTRSVCRTGYRHPPVPRQ